MDEVCVTTIIISMTINSFASTCEISSHRLSLRLLGRDVLPHSRMGSRYLFNKLRTNTRYQIRVLYFTADGNSRHVVSFQFVTTKALLRKLCI